MLLVTVPTSREVRALNGSKYYYLSSMSTCDWVFPDFRAFIIAQQSKSTDTDTSPTFQTPSKIRGSISWEKERQLRLTTCTFLLDLGKILALPSIVVISAQYHIQRFYMVQSFTEHDRFLVATAALFIASKAEESKLQVRTLTEDALYLLFHTQQNFSGNPHQNRLDTRHNLELNPRSGDSQRKHVDRLHALMEMMDTGEIATITKKVVFYERVLLLTLSFEIGVAHAFSHVLTQMDKVFGPDTGYDHRAYEDARMVAFTLLNDSIKHSLCVAFTSLQLATGAVYIAVLYTQKIRVDSRSRGRKSWWSVWNLDASELKDIAKAFLWMYQDATGQPSKFLGRKMREIWRSYDPTQGNESLYAIQRSGKDSVGV
uniref:Uncharacterized protein AlNc14C28G2706 n=1 Tax=Albugo laibachii Nc14 TaxID=890382 RepID=F0W778_9STRA|nr:conserved hypothetical protein [Albugo laibachii Nc14]|eukprot:CCA16977.1 conserved hypothetical protein [Albugo laibachii Nc14]